MLSSLTFINRLEVKTIRCEPIGNNEEPDFEGMQQRLRDWIMPVSSPWMTG